MVKLIGGVLVGIFLGSLITELLRRKRPEVIEALEAKAREVSDRLFEGIREAYDFRESTEGRRQKTCKPEKKIV